MKEEAGGDEEKELPTEDKWEENKNSKEELSIFNHKRASVHFMEMSNQVSKQQRYFMDQ